MVATQEVGGALVEEDVQAGDAAAGVGLGGAGESVQGGGRGVDQSDAAAGLDVLRRGVGVEGMSSTVTVAVVDMGGCAFRLKDRSPRGWGRGWWCDRAVVGG
ncbi:hypothetical protein AR457_38310 [Streptomyces agglomeratus]|nr:hypothetical protein AR457_38310 [Streptomyces agglomeratus]